MSPRLTIVSGAQTGADRAALDVARELDLPYRGFVPRGRLAEDGRVPDDYAFLTETPEADYTVRTRLNVEQADATVILSHGPLTGGSRFTREHARTVGKPWLHLDLTASSTADAAGELRDWIRDTGILVLNVAGPRASGDPRIAAATRAVLLTALTPQD